MIIKIKKKNAKDSFVRAIRQDSPLAFLGYDYGELGEQAGHEKR